MEERFNDLTEVSTDYVLVVDQEDRLKYVNKFTANHFNLLQSDMIGKNRNDFFPPSSSQTETHLIDDLFSIGIPLTTVS